MLADELRKMLPYLASAAAILLIISGMTSENFTGLTGNWNWTYGILTAILPAVFLAVKFRHWQIFAIGFLALFFLVIWFTTPEQFPRSAVIAAAAAILLITARNRIPEKKLL